MKPGEPHGLDDAASVSICQSRVYIDMSRVFHGRFGKLSITVRSSAIRLRLFKWLAVCATLLDQQLIGKKITFQSNAQHQTPNLKGAIST